jgi:4a-hydroxytetrahydrobiopterin dehydratase
LAIVTATGAANHHPDVDLARAISSIAAEAGAQTASATVARLEPTLDSPAYGAVLPFWGAVLGMQQPGEDGPGDEPGDPFGALPMVWFQESGDEGHRQRWHPDLWVEPAAVQLRIDAALAAGGTLVSDVQVPSLWVFADPEGNRVCLCTWQERDGAAS